MHAKHKAGTPLLFLYLTISLFYSLVVSTFFHTSNLLLLSLPGDADFQIARPWKQQRGQQNTVVEEEESEDEESESEEETET